MLGSGAARSHIWSKTTFFAAIYHCLTPTHPSSFDDFKKNFMQFIVLGSCFVRPELFVTPVPSVCFFFFSFFIYAKSVSIHFSLVVHVGFCVGY